MTGAIEKEKTTRAMPLIPEALSSLYGKRKNAVTNPPMRFCMITTFYPPYNFGGDGVFVYHLSNELARRGHKVEVIFCSDAYRLLTRGKPIGIYKNHPNVTMHDLAGPLGFFSLLAAYLVGLPILRTARIKRILDRGFDVIHYHNISLFGPKILAYGQGIKFYTLHEYWLVCPTHALFKFNKIPCKQAQCFLCTLSYRRPPQIWRYLGLQKAATGNVDLFLAPSLINLYKHRQMGLKRPIVHLPNFVPESAAAAGESSFQSDEFSNDTFFLFVGRLEKLKGLGTLIPVFINYRRARLVIAGTGSDESRLRVLSKGSQNITFCGHVTGTELRMLYRKAVALIMPTINYQGGFSELPRGAGAPMVVMEAFSQATPVLVRDVGRIPELIEESGGGIVYRTDRELVDAMNRLALRPSYRRNLGLNAYRTYLSKWTPEAHLKSYIGLIRDLTVRTASNENGRIASHRSQGGYPGGC